MSPMREEIFAVTQREITKLRVVNQTIDRVITIREAARLLNLSERQVIRLKKGVLQHGAAFIIHKNRGRKPNRAISKDAQDAIVEVNRKKYQEANFNHFKELLEEREHITVSYSTVHRILSRASIMSPQNRRKPKAHHRRKRMPQKGMLVQIDASPYPWIIGDEAIASRYCGSGTKSLILLQWQITRLNDRD
jgi:transposase